MLLLRQFEHFASAQPDAVALRCGAQQLSYAELNAKAEALAIALGQQGLCNNELVGIRLPPGIDQIVAILGVWKAGLAYLPLDTSPEREAQIIAQAKPALIIDGLEALLPGPSVKAAALPAVQGNDIAYVMFTSGSTGEPKGVLVTQANIAGLFTELHAGPVPLHFSVDDVWTQSHSFAFGFSVWEIWGALANGGCLVVVPEAERRDPARLQAVIQQNAVTVLSVTPSGFAQWLALNDMNPPESLSHIVFSGEAVVPGHIEEWFARFPDATARLINTYALTETAGRVCLHEFVRNTQQSGRLIGRACADFTLHIVDEDGTPVQSGQQGELYIGGAGVAAGYLDDAALTAERFIDFNGERVYRSGDLVKQSAEGVLEYAGRVDHQIKLRGYRIEPAEIEAAIRLNPDVKDVVVDVVEGASAGPRLVAWYVPESNRATGQAEFWPSLGEYQIYDELLYEFMNADETRVAAYRDAFTELAPGKVVLDIGTGQDALLARMAAAAGARHVYAVEVIPEAAEKAQALVAQLGLADRISVLCGDMQSASVLAAISEPVDVITQGIIGNIGSSDGIVPIWNSAAPLFAENYTAVPARCLTRLAAVELPDELLQPQLSPLAADYTQKVFAAAGAPFDVRLCVRNFPESAKLTHACEFENLDFLAELQESESGSAELSVSRAGVFDGLLLWTEVETRPGEVVDFLDNQQAWLPVFLPVPDHRVAVQAGDKLAVEWQRNTGADGVFPDYSFTVSLNGQSLKTYITRHHEEVLGRNDFYRDFHALLVEESGEADARDWLQERLPEYMQPSAWVMLPAFPLSANGKLDRSALPGPDATAGIYRAPETDLQHDLAAIWETLLDREQVGLGEDFFEIGGDSISAVRFTTEVQRLLDDTVFLAALFDAPEIAAFAEYLETHHADAIARCYGSDEPEDNSAGSLEASLPVSIPLENAAAARAEAPLSYAQQSLWFLDQLYPGNTSANEQFAIRMQGAVDTRRLQAAWLSLVEKHRVLRSRFELRGNTPVQVADKPERVAIEAVSDIGLKRLAQSEVAVSFDLRQGPLLRARLLTAADGSVLLITVHHILADGLSVELIRDELALAYQRGSLHEAEVSFADYAVWEQHREFSGLIPWWQEKLSGVDTLLNFPLATEEGLPELNELHQQFEIDAMVADELRMVARQQGVSLFMLVMALYRIVLGRFCRQSDLLIGSPVTLRNTDKLKNVIGCMVNNLPFRNSISGAESFCEVLEKEKAAVLDVLDHDGLPLEKIVEASDPVREFGRHPLFQALLMFEDRSAASVDADGVNFAVEVPHVPRPSYWDIETSVTDNGPGSSLEVVIGLQASRYDGSIARRFADALEISFAAIADDPMLTVQQMPVSSSPAELEELYAGTKSDGEDLSGGLSLPELFTLQVEKTPDAVALRTADEAWTYAQLDSRANDIALALVYHDVRPGDRIGLHLPRSPLRVAALIAILRAGAVVVPLDPAWPKQRVQYMRSLANPKLVLDEQLFASAHAPVSGDMELPVVPVDGAAWILFTSGSTGEPKGVVYSHRAAAHRINWMRESFGFTDADRFLHRTSLNFVDAWWELFGALSCGAEVVLPPITADNDPSQLLDTLLQFKVTHLVAVPSLLTALLDSKAPQSDLQLRYLITSGETLGSDLFRRFRQEVPGCQVLNTYGTTETWDISCYVCGDTGSATMPVGRPLPGVEAWVLDIFQQPVPQGVWGEVVVGGAGLPLGFIDGSEQGFARLELTDEEARYYMTGDVGRYRADGTLELGGRRDRQLKIRGLRVNPAEIEFNLRNYSGIAQAAVAVRADLLGNDQLVAWFVATEALDTMAVQAYLREWLPDVLIPRDYLQLDALPLTPSGKTDYLALPDPDWNEQAGVDYVVPVTDTEKTLALIWQEVLGVQRVGRNDDFFALRGHSLMAARLMSRVCDAFEADLPLQCLFEHPTLKGLARSIDTIRWAAGESAAGDDDDREVLRF